MTDNTKSKSENKRLDVMNRFSERENFIYLFAVVCLRNLLTFDYCREPFQLRRPCAAALLKFTQYNSILTVWFYLKYAQQVKLMSDTNNFFSAEHTQLIAINFFLLLFNLGAECVPNARQYRIWSMWQLTVYFVLLFGAKLMCCRVDTSMGVSCTRVRLFEIFECVQRAQMVCTFKNGHRIFSKELGNW